MSRVRALVVASLALATAAGGLALAAGPAAAASTQTRYVAKGGSDGSGDAVNDCLLKAKPCLTIQHAVDEANAGDTVSIGAGHYLESVTISTSLTLDGATDGVTEVTGGNGDSPAPTILAGSFDEEQQVTVTMNHLSASGNPAQGVPAVVALAADLRVSNSTISDNQGAGLLAELSTIAVDHTVINGNGVDSDLGDEFGGFGVLLQEAGGTVTNSTLKGNEIAVAVEGFESGPGPEDLPDIPPVVLRGDTISGNKYYGVANVAAAVTVDTTTFSDNGIYGVATENGSTTITQSTITGTRDIPPPEEGGNPPPAGSVPPSGAVSAFAAPTIPAGAMSIPAVTPSLARTIDPHGTFGALKIASVRPAADAPSTKVTVTGSIVADNAVPDCGGLVTDGGYNLSRDAKNSCRFSSAKHDLVKTDPKLSGLASHGGPTMTQVPLKGSPAIDAIPGGSAGCTTSATDQRGVARPQPTGGKCDIGAVELAAKPIVIHPSSLPGATVGRAYHAALTATGGQYPSYTWSLAPGSSLPAGLHLSAAGVIDGTPTKAGSYHVTISVNDPVLKSFTLVVHPAAGGSSDGSQPIANTGPPVASMTAAGAGALFAGFLLLLGAGAVGRRPGRHRVQG